MAEPQGGRIRSLEDVVSKGFNLLQRGGEAAGKWVCESSMQKTMETKRQRQGGPVESVCSGTCRYIGGVPTNISVQCKPLRWAGTCNEQPAPLLETKLKVESKPLGTGWDTHTHIDVHRYVDQSN